jgi:hypothetical protein
MTERRRPSGTTPISPDCPVCKGKGVIPLGVVPNAPTCKECGGTGKVTLERAGELFGLEPITRRDTPAALEAAKADESRDTEPAPPPIPKTDHRREPDE